MKNKIALLLLFTMSFAAFAEGIVPPDGDPLATLLQMLMNWQALSPLAIGASVIVIVMQVMKKYVGDFNFKRLLVTLLGVVWGVVTARMNGLGLLEALVAALITSGGAVALYEAVKPLLPKPA